MSRSIQAAVLRPAFLVGILALAPLAYSQSQADQDLLSMNLEDLQGVKVFGASRHFEDARIAPSSVSIITANDIRRNGWRTLADALRSLKGFYTSYDREYAYLGVRGFLRPGDYNSRVLLLMNGHRLNENIYDSALIGTAFSLDLDLIDHIEIVRGPGSSLFGTNALFGVINVITRAPESETVLEFSGDNGSNESRTGRVTLSGGKKSRSGLLSGTYHHDPGQPSLFFPEFASPLTNDGYAEAMDSARFDSVFADLRASDYRLQIAFSDNIKKFPTASYGTVFNNPADWVRDTRAYVEASLHKTVRSVTDLDFRVFYDAYNCVGGGAFQETWTPGTILGKSKARADWVGTEFDVSREFGPHRITAGAESEYNIRLLQRNLIVGQGDLSYVTDSPWLVAGFADTEFNFAPALTVHAGARFDRYSTFGGAVSPRFAVIYTLGARTAIKYILGQAFRAPNAYEQFYNDPVNIALPPVKLVPERILSNEIVGEQGLRSWASATFDLYRNNLKKLIDQVPASQSGFSWFVNDGTVHAYGLESEFTAERSSGLGARVSYTASTSRYEPQRTSLANSPVTQVKLNGTSPVSHRAFASLELMYVSTMTDYRGTRVPSYLLPNVTVNTYPLWGGWIFSSSFYNVTGHRWSSPMGPNDPEDQIQEDGMTWRFKVSYGLPRGGRRVR